MNKKGYLAALCAGALLFTTSCTSTSQFYGATTGAALGGLFGSAIGGITGGPYGSNMGTLVGMAVGGAVGAAATAPKTVESSSYYYNGYDDNDFYSNSGYSPYAALDVSHVRFVSPDNSNTIVAGQHARLVFEIRNTGNNYIYDIAPVITVSGTKHIYLSPTAIISELAPGGAVCYQAEVVATNKLKRGVADFTISFGTGDRLYTARSFRLNTRDSRP